MDKFALFSIFNVCFIVPKGKNTAVLSIFSFIGLSNVALPHVAFHVKRYEIFFLISSVAQKEGLVFGCTL